MIYMNAHELVLDEQENLEAWASHGHVIDLAMNFIKGCPVSSTNGLPWYLKVWLQFPANACKVMAVDE